MRTWLRVASAAFAVLGLSGCGQTVQGAAVASQERCPIVEYQKLPVTSSYCRKALEPDSAKSYNAQYLTIGGHVVLYIMNAESKMAKVPEAEPHLIRPYVHSVVVAVQRYTQMDYVQFEVSDTCPLEQWYGGNYTIDLGCSPLGPTNGVGLKKEQAAVVLGQAMVDDIEELATSNGRKTVYQMSMNKLGRP